MMIAKKIKTNKRGDYYLIVAVTILALLGLLFIYSASNYSASATYKDAFYFVKKQALGIGVGFFTMIIACNFDYIKLGPYIEEKGPLDNPNTNQIMYEVNRVSKLQDKWILTDITHKFWKKM